MNLTFRLNWAVVLLRVIVSKVSTLSNRMEMEVFPLLKPWWQTRSTKVMARLWWLTSLSMALQSQTAWLPSPVKAPHQWQAPALWVQPVLFPKNQVTASPYSAQSAFSSNPTTKSSLTTPARSTTETTNTWWSSPKRVTSLRCISLTHILNRW